MDDRVAQLRQERDAIASAAAAERAETERRLAEARAAGRKAGEAWARDPAHGYVGLKKLAEGTPSAVKDEVWPEVARDGFETLYRLQELWTPSAVVLAYKAEFLAAVTEMLQEVEEDLTARGRLKSMLARE